MDKAYIYFLYEKDTEMVKVGYSNCPATRSTQLKENIDLKKSYCIEGEATFLLKVEKALHKTFRLTEWWVDNKPCSDGYTEWYKQEGISNIKAYLKSCFNLSIFKAIPSLKSPKEKKILASIEENNRSLLTFLENLIKYKATFYKIDNTFVINQLLSDEVDFQFSGIKDKFTYQYLDNGFLTSINVHNKTVLREKLLTREIVDLRELVPEVYKTQDSRWKHIDEIYLRLEEASINQPSFQKIEEAVKKEKDNLYSQLETLNTNLISLTNMKNKLESVPQNHYSDLDCVLVMNEDKKVCVWRKVLNENNEVIGTEDFPFEDFGYMTLEEYKTVVLKMMEAIETIYSSEEEDRLPYNIERREQYRRLL